MLTAELTKFWSKYSFINKNVGTFNIPVIFVRERMVHFSLNYLILDHVSIFKAWANWVIKLSEGKDFFWNLKLTLTWKKNYYIKGTTILLIVFLLPSLDAVSSKEIKVITNKYIYFPKAGIWLTCVWVNVLP